MPLLNSFATSVLNKTEVAKEVKQKSKTKLILCMLEMFYFKRLL